MCGRFTLTSDADKLQQEFPWVVVPPQVQPRYNIAPSQPVALIANDNPNQFTFNRWGLIPSWAKDLSIGERLINARAETLAEKPSFRAAYLRRRCLILADGFYEWAVLPNRKTKQPYYIRLQSGEPFTFAGLWDVWQDTQGNELRSCTIITTQPNALIAPLHNRMPVILPSEAYALWLERSEKLPVQLDHLLVPYPADEMIAYPVSIAVNAPNHDAPDCILLESKSVGPVL
jgi:putative SOS response-associated peptidase YedK